jgi:ankyrin repeat protein
VKSSLALLSALLLTVAASADSPVADAAMNGDTESVRALLRGGADVNAAQGDGMTALHWAAVHDEVEMADLVLYAGANLEAATRLGGFTPLLVGSRAGSAAAVEALVKAGASVEAATSTGETALHLAAQAGSAETASALVAGGATVDAVERTKAQTPLMFAAAYGRLDVAEVLLDAGADLGLKTLVVDYPAMAASDRVQIRERTRRMALLYGEVINVDRPVDGTNQDEEEEGEVEEEADDQDDPSAEEATEQEAEQEPPPEEPTIAGEVEAPVPAEQQRRSLSYDQLVDKQGGNTALHYAAREGHPEVVKLLLDRAADIDHLTGGDQTSPMLMATINGHFTLAKWLLDEGADPNLRSDPGATPLYVAVHLQWVPKSFYPQPTAIKQETTTYLELMQALLEAGADPDVRLERHLWYTSFNHNVLGVDTWGATPFWRAAYGTDVDAMRLLVAYGADPTIPTRRPPGRVSTGNNPEDDDKVDPSGLPLVLVGGPGVYPIHAASGVGYGLGLAGNAHQHAPDGWIPSVRYLVEELGADVNARDYNGFSPLHNAAARGDVELINYLVARDGDVTVLTRKGETTADMANGPVQRVTVFPQVVALLESLGSQNNHNCVSCQ